MEEALDLSSDRLLNNNNNYCHYKHNGMSSIKIICVSLINIGIRKFLKRSLLMSRDTFLQFLVDIGLFS